MSTKKIISKKKPKKEDYRRLINNSKAGSQGLNLKKIFGFFSRIGGGSKQSFKNGRNNNLFEKPKKTSRTTLLGSFISFLRYFIVLPFLLIFLPIKKMSEVSFGVLSSRQNYLKIIFFIFFFGITFRFAQLQLFSADSNFAILRINSNQSGEIILARRGNIFIQDLSQNKLNIPVTSTQLDIDIFADIRNLQQLVQKGANLEEVVLALSSTLNIPYNEIYSQISSEIRKEFPSAHFVIKRAVTDEQRNIVLYLRSSEKYKSFNFQYWLGLSEKQTRSYPQNKLFANSIGYVPKFAVPEIDIKNRLKSCQKMIEQNQERGTSTGEYLVGYYGLEQKYCSELGGVNGLRKFGFTRSEDEKPVINGADIYLTIDKNLQERSEQILAESIRNQTNSVGAPKDGTVIIMEAKTGKIRAMASWPTYDPNDYQRYWLENPDSFRNPASNVDFDIGSVMKPITVATALNVYQSGFQERGVRKGIPADFAFIDYDAKGKPYTERDGKTFYIQNADGNSFKAYGKIGLKEIIRDSINTGIADIVDATGARKLNEYWTERFKFGQPTEVSLPGDEHGNISTFDSNANCPICYANFGFGQGFTASAIQLMRAYTPIANGGYLVEPYLVEKIVNKNGVIDDGSSSDSQIPRRAQQQVISPTTASLVTSYMQSVIDEGYLNVGKSAASVPGYHVAAKTGTAEVNRPYIKTDASGRPELDEKGNPILVPCDYTCNRKRGRYDQTFIGFAPAKDPKYIVLIKLSEPNPGEVKNFSSVTLARPFSEIMNYALNYAGVPKDY